MAVARTTRSAPSSPCSRSSSRTFGSRSATAIASASVTSGLAAQPSGRSQHGQSTGERATAASGERAEHSPRARTPADPPPRPPSLTRPQPEVLEDHRRHVAQRPLLALVRRLGPAADEEQRPERVAGVQRAVAAAAGVGDPAPVDRLEAERERDDEVAGVRRGQRRPDPGQRVGVGLAAQPAVLDRRRPAPPGSPSTSQRPPRRSRDLAAGPEAQRSPRRARPPPTRRRPAGIPGSSRRSGSPSASSSRQTRSTPSITASRAATAARLGPLALARQQVDVGGAAGRADRQLGLLGPVLGGLQHRPLARRAARPAAGRGGRRSGRGRRAGSARGRRGSRRGRRPPRRSCAKQRSALAIDSTLASGPWRWE